GGKGKATGFQIEHGGLEWSEGEHRLAANGRRRFDALVRMQRHISSPDCRPITSSAQGSWIAGRVRGCHGVSLTLCRETAIDQLAADFLTRKPADVLPTRLKISSRDVSRNPTSIGISRYTAAFSELTASSRRS